MPRPKENAPPPVQFNLRDLQLGRKKFRSGSSGPAVQLAADPMSRSLSKIQRHETFLCGKIMFGNKRFSFEVMEIDRSPQNIAKLLRKDRMGIQGQDSAPTFFEMLIATSKCPVQSFQVKFEDVQSMECHRLQEEWDIVLNLKKLSCYAKKNGGSWQTMENPAGNAKTIRFVTAAPDERKAVGWQCENQMSFERARAFAMERSPVLTALFNGIPVEKEVVAPVKRKANKDTPANVAKRLKKEAEGSKKLSEAQSQRLDVEAMRKSLNDYVKSLAETVDADWHDSYEETGEMIVEWFNECGEHVQTVIEAATTLAAGFGHAHEMLKCISDTWLNINAIPFRSCPTETLNDAGEVELIEGEPLNSIEDMLKISWPLLLARAAGDTKILDSTLNQMLKDANDNGVSNPELPHEGEQHLVSKSISKVIAAGRQRLSQLAATGDWKACPCTVKKHRMRPCIDRRFDGPKHLRTRNYSDSESDCGFGFGLW